MKFGDKMWSRGGDYNGKDHRAGAVKSVQIKDTSEEPTPLMSEVAWVLSSST